MWWLTIRTRKEGGKDLYLDFENSEFERLETEKITSLRKQLKQGREVFMGALEGTPSVITARHEAKKLGRDWLFRNPGLEQTPGDKVAEFLWKVEAAMRLLHWPSSH